MRKGLVLGVLALVMVFAMTSVAVSYPNKAACGGCHSVDSAVRVVATETSNNGTNATYSVVVTGPYDGTEGWAVFSGSSNIANGNGASRSFTVAVGSTYTVWGVDDASGGKGGSASVSISPAGGGGGGSVSDVTVTVTNASGAPLSGATVKVGALSAKTNTSGVAVVKSVPYGTQTLSVSAKNYKTYTASVTIDSATESFAVTLQSRR